MVHFQEAATELPTMDQLGLINQEMGEMQLR
jgi:hypothetical protein